MSTPPKLQRIVDLFADAPQDVKLQALLDYSRRVPPLPPELAEHPELLEKVHECQSPFFLKAEVAADGTVSMYFDAPPEAPTTRGYAGILAEGLVDATADEILAIPQDFYLGLGLADVISPLRLRGMGAIVARLQRQVREQVEGKQ
ncbi:MAG: SufE family protein, partial [Actinomycetota bacterium]|nr:SufE family protein [Actinomycetota bacterium]